MNILKQVKQQLDYMTPTEQLTIIPLLYTYHKLTGKTTYQASQLPDHKELAKQIERITRKYLEPTDLEEPLTTISKIPETSDTISDIYTQLSNQLKDIRSTGEYYTPPAITRLMIQIAKTNIDTPDTVYDPTCGTGAILVEAHNEYPDAKLYGQEQNQDTATLARLNLELHGATPSQVDIQCGCTLVTPKHADKQFKCILTNPPYSLGKPEELDIVHDKRFRQYGGYIREDNMDYSFIQHMLSMVSSDGVIVSVEPVGVLFKRKQGAPEIRESLIEEHNLVDTVVALPKAVFKNTGINTCLVVFRKERDTEDVLLVDASSIPYTKGEPLCSGDVERIIDTVKNRREVEGWSCNVTPAMLAENNYNLNVNLYVKPCAGDGVDIEELVRQHAELLCEISETRQEINRLLSEVGAGYEI